MQINYCHPVRTKVFHFTKIWLHLSLFFLNFTYSDNHVIPSFKPIPSSALLDYKYQGLSFILSNYSSFITSFSVIALFKSILLAKKSMGNFFILISWWSKSISSSFFATYILNLSTTSMTNMTAYIIVK